MLDLRGIGGLTVSADPLIAFSPDKLYVVVLRMTAVNAESRTIGRIYYETYGLRELRLVTFRTPDGQYATTDNILGWSSQHPHALEISINSKMTALAYPGGGE